MWRGGTVKRNSRFADSRRCGPGAAKGVWLRRARLFAGTAIAVLAALLAAVSAATLAPAAPVQASSGTRAASVTSGTVPSKLALLDVVVLVDESGSETPQKVADEQATVG